MAEERTANDASRPAPSASLSYAAAISRSSSAGKGWFDEPAPDLLARRGERRDVGGVESGEPRRNAPVEPVLREELAVGRAVVANPPGTRTPAPESWLIISPSEEFLPPTLATSAARTAARSSMRELALMAIDPSRIVCR